MSGDRIEGYKEIKRLLDSLGVPSSRWTIMRWVAHEADPFPLRRRQQKGGVRYFVYTDGRAVREWVSRNFDVEAG